MRAKQGTARSHRRKVPAVAAVVVALAVVTAGCANSHQTSGSSQTSSEGATPTPSGTPWFLEEEHEEAEAEEHTFEEAPEAQPDSEVTALAAAENVLAAFARPTLSEEEWWNQLVPLLSQKGAVAYEYTLPANIPVTEITGPGEILEGASDVIILVQLPTDDGPYIVTLTRGSVDEPWLAERVRPAGG